MNRKSKTDEKRKKGGGGGDGDGFDEVDSLLRAAEDELLLKLSLNSHTSRCNRGVSVHLSPQSSSDLHPDLDRRFQSLKTEPSPSTTTNKSAQPPPTTKTPPAATADDDDLFARFAALKGTLPSSSSSFKPSCGDEQSDRDESDEVEKLMQWAIDAARLDPSPPTDSDNDENDDAVDHSDDDDDDDDGYSDDEDHRKKGEKKKAQKRK